MIVLEFNEAFLKDAASITELTQIISSLKDEKLLIVVSSMASVNSLFEKLHRSYTDQEENTQALFDQVKNYHDDLIGQLLTDPSPVYDEVANTFIEIDWMLEDEPHPDEDFNYDQIVSIGPLVSSKIIASALTEKGFSVKWIDARGIIHTDNTYRSGIVDMQKTKRSIEAITDSPEQILISQGSVGGTSENFSTTLGPDGVDYAAALFASFTSAGSLHIRNGTPGHDAANRNTQLLKNASIEICVYPETRNDTSD